MVISEKKLFEMSVKAVAFAVAGAQAHGTGGGGGGSGQGRVIMDKAFSVARMFDKGDSLWEDWSHDFKAALGIQSPETRNTLEVVEGYPDDLNIKHVKDLDPEKTERTNLGQRAAEIFQILVLKTE